MTRNHQVTATVDGIEFVINTDDQEEALSLKRKFEDAGATDALVRSADEDSEE